MTSSISQHVVSTITTRRQAVAAVRGCADSLIEQMTRQAAGMDRGRYRDDTRSVDCRPDNSIRARIAFNVTVAFALSRKFANVDTGTLADLVEADARAVEADHAARPMLADLVEADARAAVAPLVEAGIVEPVSLPGLPEGVAAFQFVGRDAILDGNATGCSVAMVDLYGHASDWMATVDALIADGMDRDAAIWAADCGYRGDSRRAAISYLENVKG